MSEPVISVAGLSKRYLIAHKQRRGSNYQYRSLREELAAKFRSLGTRRPATERESQAPASPSKESFWALDDVSFDIDAGQALGVIGRNGAGKSTLLKILSRITHPTKGRIEMRGRVASLLEVGTGFHPELTGRENIFLNGSILGMGRSEINRKFDEIVAFADVERFLDTPVKRYSSGMYVRLAFAVAANLDPEILIVDEVLAVGDAAFQRRCLNKMGQISKSGRTIIFVSHNLSAIKSLTQKCILLVNGKNVMHGATEQVTNHYLTTLAGNDRQISDPNNFSPGSHSKITAVTLKTKDGGLPEVIEPRQDLLMEVVFERYDTVPMSVELFLLDHFGSRIGIYSTYQMHDILPPERPGTYKCSMPFRLPNLASGSYSLDVHTSIPNIDYDALAPDCCRFEVNSSTASKTGFHFTQSQGFGYLLIDGATAPQFEQLTE